MLNPENSDISHLFGKFLNIAGDIGNQDLKDTSMFKMLTGRDLVSGRRKYMTNIHFQNYAKFIFSCNELPMVYDMTKGFWDRWILLEYPYTFVCQDEFEKSKANPLVKVRDEGIIEKITTPEEMSGFLNQALIGLNRLLANKGFSYTLGTEEVKSKWIRKSNSFMAFCYDFIEGESDGSITKKELRKKYAEFCKQHKIAPRSDVVIKRVLQDNYGVIEERREVLGIYEWIWEGIKLK
jgi:putative DNA primase/helicase